MSLSELTDFCELKDPRIALVPTAIIPKNTLTSIVISGQLLTRTHRSVNIVMGMYPLYIALIPLHIHYIGLGCLLPFKSPSWIEAETRLGRSPSKGPMVIAYPRTTKM
jgi:hypothetical protein